VEVTHTRRYTFILTLTLLLLLGLPLIVTVVRAQVLTPRPEELRFQMLLHEPVATPDRRSVVAGTDTLLIKDRRSGQCYVAMSVGQSMAMAAASCEE
jgi:energy-converting hydrogenase Eha subunit F